MRQFVVISLCALAIFNLTVAAQEGRILSGVVTGFTSIPLNNVRVTTSKSDRTVVTDQSGQFSIQCSEKDVLLFQAAGFKQKKIKPGKESIFKVDLSYNIKPSSFDEATGNKHISVDALQQAIEADQLKKMKDFSKYSSIWELIDSEIYEVRVTGNAVYNNKVKSMNSNPQVVYVVDEKIVSDISYISPMYVRSIEFVDDVGATLYGSRGANGVLKIVLK